MPRQVSFKVSIAYHHLSNGDGAKLSEVLQSPLDKYLTRLPKLDSVAFKFNNSAYHVKYYYGVASTSFSLTPILHSGSVMLKGVKLRIENAKCRY